MLIDLDYRGGKKCGFLSDLWRTVTGRPTRAEERIRSAQAEEKRKKERQASLSRGVAREGRGKRTYDRSGSTNTYLG